MLTVITVIQCALSASSLTFQPAFMPKAERTDESSTSRAQSSSDPAASEQSNTEDRFVTDEEWKGLKEDAEQFKEKHDSFFQRLSKR